MESNNLTFDEALEASESLMMSSLDKVSPDWWLVYADARDREEYIRTTHYNDIDRATRDMRQAAYLNLRNAVWLFGHVALSCKPKTE